MIRVHDAYGRELFITKQAWRDSVLIGNLEKLKNQPDELASMIIMALQDGFYAEVLPYAKHLATTDTNHERGHMLHAVTLLQLKEYSKAETVIAAFIRTHGETGTALTNLAKVHAGRNDNDRMIETLWRGLTLDPNQENGLLWYESIFREKGGDAAGNKAFEKVAALPGSWRSQLWLARNCLKQQNLSDALSLYAKAIANAPAPVPADLLQQISGDLGQHGHLPEILQLTLPHFNARHHGIVVGNNLIKAHFDLGQLDAAQNILNALYELKRPDWSRTLSFWDNEIAKMRVSIADKIDPARIELTLLSIEGPVWLPARISPLEIFQPKRADAPVIALLGGSVESDALKASDQPQLSNEAGRLSRAIPLYLAERVEFFTTSTTRTLVPYITSPNPAFALMGSPMPDGDAAQHARNNPRPADYAIITHIIHNISPWLITLRLIRTIDTRCLFETSVQYASSTIGAAIGELEAKLLSFLPKETDIAHATPPPSYQTVPASSVPGYLSCSEQLLAIRAAATHKETRTLHGERDILMNQLLLCAQLPLHTTPRLILSQSLIKLKEMSPNIVAEFKERVATLEKEKPLPATEQPILSRIFSEIFS
ncbi:tetratricopeptide (TPR) repeat protein [Ereboglobus sp. PH5-5]|uniref:tetratricopeptide repeat protein n=1 Tax=Ereboglobus sp. PH5-5 TaxID=2940529 RepID=UPI00240637E6|nr:hypothetical protein [Ereboglobus sp. PH5-5]MDF9833971.1 tetratricopeptide (TPR) repeat protein [Ereboglobus sp. PH5-5]